MMRRLLARISLAPLVAQLVAQAAASDRFSARDLPSTELTHSENRPIAGSRLWVGDSSLRVSVFGSEPVNEVGPAPASGALLVTNVVQLQRLGAGGIQTSCFVRLKGLVLAAAPRPGLVVFQDDSGAALLDIDHVDCAPQPGQQVVLEGSCVVEGTSVRLRSPPLVDNDGVHSMGERSASVFLSAGKHRLRLLWFNRDAPYGLEVYYQGPDLPRRRIPDSALFHLVAGSTAEAPQWTNGLTYRCFEGRWLRVPDFRKLLPVKEGICSNFDPAMATRPENAGLEFSGYLDVPRSGPYTLSSVSDDGSLLFIDERPTRVTVVGTNALPAPRPIAAGQLLRDAPPDQWCVVEGTVAFSAEKLGGLELEVTSGAGRMRVEVADSFGVSPSLLLDARIRAVGISQSTSAPDGEQIAGSLQAPSLAEIKLLEVPSVRWEQLPLVPIGQLAGANPPLDIEPLVRVGGAVQIDPGSGAFMLADEAGQATVEAVQRPPSPGQHIEVLGRCSRAGANMVLRGAVYRHASGKLETDSGGLPLLTTVEQVKRLTREEAQRSYPVKIRGIVTTVLVGGFFIQDGTWSIYARADAPLNTDFARIGDYWEVEGVTFAEFAPNIRASRAVRLGPGTLPEPLRPAWDQLINGSLDTQYVEVQGVVTSVEADGMTLLTRVGKIKIQLSDVEPQSLKQYENALIRVRGCVIPERNLSTQQVELGRLHLSNASVSVDEPPPADLFAVPAKHAADLLFFDPRAGALQRVKLSGQILHQRGNEYFLADGAHGLRVVPKDPVQFRVGALVEVVGFPQLGGPSPVLREAVLRQVGQAALPTARVLSQDALLDSEHDATLVRVTSRLASVSVERTDQVLVLQAGTRGFIARLKGRDGFLVDLAPGSRLELTGVYVGQGGDRASGRDLDGFELLLNSPSNIRVLERPSWWTVRHTLTIVGAMTLAILAALVWISLLRGQVEERTRQLAAEIRRHEQTARQRELEQERARIARDLHDDLGASLTQIRLLSALESRDSQLPETNRGRMKEVSEKSREMVASLDEIVWAVNPANDSLPSLATYLCQFAEEFFRPTSVRCRLDVDDSLPPAALTSEVRHHLYLVLREALNNIAKHSQASEVWIRIRWHDRLHISIEDNGCGFSPSSSPPGEGLTNMRRRLEKIGGRFECDSQSGKGTVCRLELPLQVSTEQLQLQ